MVLYAIVPVGTRAPRGLRVAKTGRMRVVVGEGPVPEPTKEALAAFDAAVRSIRADAVLPFRFGTNVADDDAIATLLRPLEGPIEAALARVHGCVQYTHRVYGRAAPPPKRRRGQGPGAAFMAAKLHATQVPEVRGWLEALRPYVREQRIERASRAPLIASVYHLVERRREARYRRALAIDPSPCRIDTSGPWPPYAFAELA